MDSVSIGFTGDISFTHFFSSPNDMNSLIDDNTQNFLASCDYCVGNIEGAIMSKPEKMLRPFEHYSETKYAQYLENNNIKIWNLANNHALDFGEYGILQTEIAAENNDSQIIGIGKTIQKKFGHILSINVEV